MSQPKVITILATYFDNYAAGDLGSSATAFFAALCIEWDQLMRPEWVSWRLETACSKSGLTRNTVQKARQRLEEAGWIAVATGNQKNATKYAPRIPGGVCQNLTRNVVNDSSEFDENVTESSRNRDEIVVPYIPLPKPNPKPLPNDGYDQEFDEFWLSFTVQDQKPSRGNKKKAYLLWKELTDEDRQRCIDVLPSYTAARKSKGRGTHHLTTWINQRLFAQEWGTDQPTLTTEERNTLTDLGCGIGRPDTQQDWRRMIDDRGMKLVKAAIKTARSNNAGKTIWPNHVTPIIDTINTTDPLLPDGTRNPHYVMSEEERLHFLKILEGPM